MKEMLEEWTKTMEKMWSPWQQMMQDQSWLQRPEIPFKIKWSSWMAALRSTYDVNSSWVRTFMEQSEEISFKMFKESPFYNQAAEEQMREFWAGLKKAQVTHGDTVKTWLDKMESMLKEQEEAR